MITITIAIFALIGLALTVAGSWLISLGGSPYYVIAGVGFLVTAFLLHRRNAIALWLYAVIVLGSLAWGIVEVGFDWWQLAPRGGVLVLLCLWLMLPAVRRKLDYSGPAGIPHPSSVLPVAAAATVSVIVAIFAMTQDPHDIAGELPTEVIKASPHFGGDVPDGEWHQYGRTAFGQRYSPLDQITTENVSSLKVAWQYQTGDVKRPDDVSETTYQVTPLKIGDSLYVCTPHNWAIAIDAETGKEK